MLASESPVFRAMFQHEMKEQRKSTVDILDMTIDGLQLFLLVLYTTNEHRPREFMPFSAAVDKHFVEFWEAAWKYQVVSRLQHVLFFALLRNLTPENCWLYYDQCSLQAGPGYGAFLSVCHQYIVGNYNEVITAETVLEEMRRNPKRVQSLMILAECQATRDAALKWYNEAKGYASL